MKKSLFSLLVLLLIAVTAFCQTKKSLELLKEGIETNDEVKINKALSKEVTMDDCLLEAIAQNKSDYVRDFINRGANPSKGLSTAVFINNLDLVKYLLERGAKFEGDSVDIIVRDSAKIFDFGIVISIGSNNSVFFSYKTKKVLKGNRSIIYAINNNNIQMIELLIAHGIKPSSEILVREFSGYLSQTYNHHLTFSPSLHVSEEATFHENGLVVTNKAPVPEIIMNSIEYAMCNNADRNIVDVLIRYDSLSMPNYKLDIKKVSYISENPKVSDIEMTSFGYGFTLKFKLRNENIYGYKLAYSADNVNVKDIKDISYPIDTTNSIFEYNESITNYYYDELGNKIQSKKLILKIIPKECGTFTDPRDGKKYRTVKIGNHVVMAENFRYKMPSGCWAYDDNESNAKKYGYLYSWDTAMKVASEGWHLPSAKELEDLFSTVIKHSQPSSQIVKYDEIVNAIGVEGNDGFNMLYCGVRQFGAHKEYNYIGNLANFWSSDTFSGGKAVSATFINPKNTQKMLNPVFVGYSYLVRNSKPIGCSVRLFKDK